MDASDQGCLASKLIPQMPPWNLSVENEGAHQCHCRHAHMRNVSRHLRRGPVARISGCRLSPRSAGESGHMSATRYCNYSRFGKRCHRRASLLCCEERSSVCEVVARGMEISHLNRNVCNECHRTVRPRQLQSLQCDDCDRCAIILQLMICSKLLHFYAVFSAFGCISMFNTLCYCIQQIHRACGTGDKRLTIEDCEYHTDQSRESTSVSIYILTTVAWLQSVVSVL